MAKDNPTKAGGMRRFDELVAIRSVFGNDTVLLEELVRVMSNRDASYLFRRVAKSFDVTGALNRELDVINQRD
jgi:hypothetical protein|tara:strand:- start:188 stop:406 length:219 start_codon:yes stop_codon:yes gene_type:complete